MSKEIKDAAQQQSEQAFDGFMYWMKKGTIVSCLILAIVVVGCNGAVIVVMVLAHHPLISLEHQ